MTLRFPFARLGFIFGVLTAGIFMISLAATEPAKPGLIIIQGPRPEVRRYLPVKPGPEPQGHPSGWLYPAAKTVRREPVSKKPERTPLSKSLPDKPVANYLQPPPVSIKPSSRLKESGKPKLKSPPAPVAEKIREGLVKSPYAPHVPLDVQGLPSGTLAKDPVTGKLFRVP